MSGARNDGGPAFPSTAQIERRFTDGSAIVKPLTEGGMTLRDYFAAKAMQALLSRIDPVSGDYVTNATPEQGAERAYRYADAMLKARTA